MTWNAAPSAALWYGEVIYSLDDGDTNYSYGYSSHPEPDDPRKHLVPEGAELVEYSVRATPRNEEPILFAWGESIADGEWTRETREDESDDDES